MDEIIRIGMIKLKKRSLTDIFTQLNKSQFLPDSKDIENEELKKLANRLKGDSDKQILTNILEWQHRNIPYWMERGILEIPWLILTPIYFFLCIIVATLISLAFYFVILPFLGTAWSIKVGLLAFLIFLAWSMLQRTIIKVIYTLLFSYPVYIFIKLFLVSSSTRASVIEFGLTVASLNGVLFGVSLLTIIYLVASYLPLFRGDSIKTKISKLFKILSDTFKFSLSVERILNYRRAICRDYAKLTASLLFRLYPNFMVYFITIPRHVAAAIKINDIYYILDQRLPILTIDRWLINWNQEKAEIYISKVLRDSIGKPISVDFSEYEKVIRKLKAELPAIDTEKLTEDFANMLKIKQSLHKDEPDFKIHLKNYAIYYEDNDITKYSLIRAVKNKLESELCGSMDKTQKLKLVKIIKT